MEYVCMCVYCTCSKQGSSSVVHGQSVHQLAGGGAQWPPLKQREGQRRVVRGDVQLERGVDADQQVDGLDGEFLQPHGSDQRQRGLEHLHRTTCSSVSGGERTRPRLRSCYFSSSTCSGRTGPDTLSWPLWTPAVAVAMALSGM